MGPETPLARDSWSDGRILARLPGGPGRRFGSGVRPRHTAPVLRFPCQVPHVLTFPHPRSDSAEEAPGHAVPYARAALGGALMGLANLVPGISGGTMLLAAGIYGEFIEAVAAVTRLRLRRAPVLLLFAVVGAASIAIALFAGPVKNLVVDQRWLAYSLFVGLTLGGIPALWRLARPITPGAWAGIIAGFAAMSLLGLAQQSGTTAVGITGSGMPALVVAGAAGAASMILPGISGGYLLLILGQYLPILGAIDRAVKALRSMDIAALVEPVVYVIVPVGVGLVLGIALMSNLLRYLLHAHRAVTLGLLLGLLGGVVIGLWPFQEGVAPVPGTHIKGVVVTFENAGDFDPEDWPVRVFPPTGAQIGLSVVLILVGAGATRTVSRIGKA